MSTIWLFSSFASTPFRSRLFGFGLDSDMTALNQTFPLGIWRPTSRRHLDGCASPLSSTTNVTTHSIGASTRRRYSSKEWSTHTSTQYILSKCFFWVCARIRPAWRASLLFAPRLRRHPIGTLYSPRVSASQPLSGPMCDCLLMYFVARPCARRPDSRECLCCSSARSISIVSELFFWSITPRLRS
jgi:hypothetical protein